jgi:hypothetical protein
MTIDQLSDVHGHPDAVLVDVEGWEANVLRGARRTIRSGASFCIEVHSGHGLEESGGSVLDVVNAFPREYLVRVVDFGGTLRPVSENVTSGRFFLLALPAG